VDIASADADPCTRRRDRGALQNQTTVHIVQGLQCHHKNTEPSQRPVCYRCIAGEHTYAMPLLLQSAAFFERAKQMNLYADAALRPGFCTTAMYSEN
jgi:hypothetical protein